MKTIAIIGANGQVGTELCITLSLMPNVRVVAICRSELSAALLKRCGIECRIGSVTAPNAGMLLEGCDVVCDLALPRGSVSEVRRANLNLISRVIAACPEDSTYVFGSTTMALGVREVHDKFVRRWISRTAYGANKRVLERFAKSAGRKRGISVFVLRFGDVHGEMQGISRNIRRNMTSAKVIVPAAPSNSVFIFSIAEALANIAAGRETPATYTLTSVPQWSWKDLHNFYAKDVGVEPEIVEVPYRSVSMGSRIKPFVSRMLLRNREFLTGYVLVHFPKMERKAKADHLIRKAKAEIEQSASQIPQPYRLGHVGSAPGKRLKSLSNSRETMPPFIHRVRGVLKSLVSS